MQEEPHPQKQPKFLPPYFKFIGGGIILLGLILILTKVVFGQSTFIPPNIALGISLFGFFIYAFAKGKIGDEKLIEKKCQPGLPNYFKKIGIGTILFVIIVLIPFAIWLKKFNPEAFENYRHIFRTLFMDIIYIGFLLYVLAREKVEDELIVKIRLVSIAFAFFSGVFWVIMQPIIHYILNNEFEEPQAQEVILWMFFMYTMIFHISKKNR